ncbi:MAG: hypothetical protein A2052_01565 [Deltaproteobacteria bacterium GWA2_54_12]|nr:MAG: hypothetical protein A2052_01565 [Deltaproteobacteria bacterium GWA2_54_12]
MKKTRILFLLLAAVLLTSCHPKPKLAYLVPDTQGLAGYKARGSESIFENKALLASARQVRKGEVSNPFLASLLEKDFVIISMKIENRSVSKAIYKPNYTALVNAVDYLKPLDYTDLYELDGEAADSLKGKFYDLDTTIPPGGSVAGLLIFTPVSKEAKKAAVQINEFYIGTQTMTFSLPFQLKATP